MVFSLALCIYIHTMRVISRVQNDPQSKSCVYLVHWHVDASKSPGSGFPCPASSGMRCLRSCSNFPAPSLHLFALYRINKATIRIHHDAPFYSINIRSARTRLFVLGFLLRTEPSSSEPHFYAAAQTPLRRLASRTSFAPPPAQTSQGNLANHVPASHLLTLLLDAASAEFEQV